MSDQADSEPEQPVVKSQLNFPVVGIGASAGGLDALQSLVADMPSDCGMAFVIVMHLSPDHVSSLGPILQRAGTMPVTTVVETTCIEAGHIYVISPAVRLEMSDGELRVAPSASLEGRRQSIDHFFRSLAQAHQERAVCVVLSGTGSDGAQGLQRIKELGGVAIAQSIDDAQFDGMPRSAIETGFVDFILPVSEMAAKLMLLWQNARRIELPSPPTDLEVESSAGEAQQLAEEALLSIKAILRERTGHDFTHYKRGTVLRRLERRMQVNAVADLPSYRRLLDTEPKETAALLQDMLISVTNFFRDPHAFSALETALEPIATDRSTQEPFRAWVAGCATGEEAYSLAIVLREVLGTLGPPSQIFASDIDQRAVAAARTGQFPLSIAADVSDSRLSSAFTADAGGYRILKELREQVVFSTHNLLSDPPFTRMDLICCRNLMIYLDRQAQEQLLRSLHFALKPRGLLFLGGSETAEAAGSLFEPVDKAHRLYRAAVVPTRSRALPPVPTRMPVVIQLPSRTPHVPTAKPPLELLHDRLLKSYAPPAILVDADDTVLHVSERASHLMRMPEGAPTNKLMALIRPELRAELRAAVARATLSGKVVEAPRVRLTVNGESHVIIMTARPAVHETPPGLMLIVFDEAEESLAVGPDEQPLRDPVVETLETELMRAQEQLHNMVGESAASTEELRASNEELQTINEELRSTTEELETSREELQAVNEELTTVNTELTVRVDETAKVNDDLQNLMTSADIGTVFIDRDMRVKRYTPQAATLFNLLPNDVGRSLLDITHRLEYPSLVPDITEVLRDLKRVEREIQSQDGRWFASRIAPYRTSDDRIDGVVLAFFDVTARKTSEQQLVLSEQRMAMVVDSMRDYAIITMDGGGTITSWSVGAERIFGYSQTETLGQSIDLIFTEKDRRERVPKLALTKALSDGRADDDRWHLRKSGDRVFVSGITTPLGNGGAMGFAKIARDYTDVELRQERRDLALASEQATSERLQKDSALKDEFLAVVSHELKNPLSLINMHAELLSRLPTLATEPKALRSVKAVKSAVTAQAQIINDLLELSRTNTGKVNLTLTTFDFSDLVSNVLEAAGSDALAKDLTLKVDLTSAFVEADSIRLEQIVWNLVTNAVKFTPQGGVIQVRLSVAGSVVTLEVTDSGIGIEQRQLANVFEMFHQVETGPNRGRSGLGIGLALVKQLIELHDGSVRAESEGLGRGSRFYVSIPLAEGNASHEANARPVKPLAGLRILAVDDEAEQLTALGAVLEGEGAQVTLAGGAEEALSLARARYFDAIISDLAMPKRDGFWLAERLREGQRTRTTPLFAFSGMARRSERLHAISAGFDSLILKPVDVDFLLVELLDVIQRRSDEGSAI